MSPIVLKKEFIIIIVLCVSILFLFMDKCGSSRKVDELKGQYKEASRIAKIERQIKEETIKEQQGKIEKLTNKIEVRNAEIVKKEQANVKLDGSVADLEREFDDLEQQDAKIGNLMQQVEVWKEKFALAQSIIADKDEIIFSLTEKYDAQLVISNSYKDLYETLVVNTKKLEKIVTAQDRQIKRFRLTSGLKTGVVIGLAGLVVYGVLK